jgi:hypothetical protein
MNQNISLPFFFPLLLFDVSFFHVFLFKSKIRRDGKGKAHILIFLDLSFLMIRGGDGSQYPYEFVLKIDNYIVETPCER